MSKKTLNKDNLTALSAERLADLESLDLYKQPDGFFFALGVEYLGDDWNDLTCLPSTILKPPELLPHLTSRCSLQRS